VSYLRNHRWIAVAAALLLLATIAAAALAPHFKRADVSDFQVLCTAGGMKLVKADGTPSTQAHTLECPSCLGALAAPPTFCAPVPLAEPRFSKPVAVAQYSTAREALAALARGPPLLAS
jgi:hypothetical protein